MKTLLLALALSLAPIACAPAVQEAPRAPARPIVGLASTGNPAIGGVAMPPTRTIAQNAAAAPNLAVLVRAITAAGLLDTLSGPGPFTVFAPTDEAFGRLAPGTVEALLKLENKASLVKLVTYHVVPGAFSGAQLMQRITAAGGRATLTSVEGEPLAMSMTGNIVTLTDAGGNKSYVEVADVRQANGVVHVVNGVLIPRVR